ncbi:MAG: hypothetical protein AB7G11_13350 [Phycisphaerales bacterium]
MATQTFFYDGTESYTGGLSMTFTRGVPTCDYGGNEISGNNDKRYDRTVAVAAASADPKDILTSRSDEAALLVGSDQTSDAITKLTIDSAGKARLDHVFGVQSSMSFKGIFKPSAFIIKVPRS